MEIDALKLEIRALKDELAKKETELESLIALERQGEWSDVSNQFGVNIADGKPFIVTQAIADYVKLCGWDTGYHPVWLVGQNAYVDGLHISPDKVTIRATCLTGHKKPIQSGGHTFGFSNVMSLSSPFPAQLIVDAIKATDQ